MLSPHTPPGTKIVCIDGDPVGKYNHILYWGTPNLNGLTQGEVYTVLEIYKEPLCMAGLAVSLVEITRPHRNPQGYALQRFRRAELPRILKEIEAGGPVDPNAFEEPKRRVLEPLHNDRGREDYASMLLNEHTWSELRRLQREVGL